MSSGAPAVSAGVAAGSGGGGSREATTIASSSTHAANAPTDSQSETAARKVSKLSFEPTMTPDMIIVKAFTANKKVIPQPPFPRLHPTVVQERAQPYLKQVEEDKKKRPVPMLSLPPPTTPWYPEKLRAPLLGKPLTPNLPTSLSSPRSVERASARHEVNAEVVGKLGAPIPTNCRILYSCLCAEMDQKGYLTAVQLTKLFQETCNIVDITHVDSFFRLLDTRRRGSVHVLHIIAALDVVLNGPDREAVRRACFEPFNLDQRGYIHKSCLEQLKREGKVDDTSLTHSASADGSGGGVGGATDTLRTPEMVKVLNDLFIEIGKEEEEAYIQSLSKGKGKKKKAPPLKSNQKTVIPIGRARVSHMNFTGFDRWFTESKTMAVAFARCWLPLVESRTDMRLHIIEKLQELAE